jgi:uncharacterized protein (TIGR03086 family)
MVDTQDPRPLYARALDQTESIVEAVRLDQLGNPTPCTEYDVRTLLSHMVGGLKRIAYVGEGGNALDVVPVADGVPDDGWPDAFRQSGQRVRAAWADDATLDALATVPWGQVPGRAALAGYVQEVVMHGWDLATATGQQTELDPELAEFALVFAHQALPPEHRGPEVPFGPVTPAPDGAGPYAQLAAWLGRTLQP